MEVRQNEFSLLLSEGSMKHEGKIQSHHVSENTGQRFSNIT